MVCKYKDWEFQVKKIGVYIYEVTGSGKVIAYTNSEEEADSVIGSFIDYLKSKEK